MRSLYKVVGRLIVMEMKVFKLVVIMLVAERCDGEREREREVLLAAEIGLGRLVFLLSLDPNFSIHGA